MFTDPISLTDTDLGAVSLPRRTMGAGNATYVSSDDVVSLRIAHTTAKRRTRRLVRLDRIRNLTDALTGTSKPFNCAVYLVIDVPARSAADIDPETEVSLTTDFLTWLTASTNANLVKVTASES